MKERDVFIGIDLVLPLQRYVDVGRIRPRFRCLAHLEERLDRCDLTGREIDIAVVQFTVRGAHEVRMRGSLRIVLGSNGSPVASINARRAYHSSEQAACTRSEQVSSTKNHDWWNSSMLWSQTRQFL